MSYGIGTPTGIALDMISLKRYQTRAQDGTIWDNDLGAGFNASLVASNLGEPAGIALGFVK